MTAIPKPTTERSADYLAFVRSQGCIVTGCKFPADAHHVVKPGHAKTGKKADDTRTVGLCRIHHGIYHREGRERFEQLYAVLMDYEILKLQREYAKLQKPAKRKIERKAEVKVTVKYCACKRDHTLPLSKLTFGKKVARYLCPVKGWVEIRRAA